MGSMRYLAFICILVTSAMVANGETFYVAPNGHDTNPGTLQKPWRTIQKASDSLKPGDTILIRAGTYREQVIPGRSGRNGNYIEYRAYPGDRVTIDGRDISLPEWESGLIHIEEVSYIRVVGLRIINAGPHENSCGIYVDNSSHIVIEKNYTYNTVSSGIGVWNSSNIIIDGNEVELACNDGEQECITVAGTGNFEIRNNHVHHGGPGTNGGEGIDLKDGSHDGKVYGNLIHHLRGERTGIYLDAWDKHTYNIEVFRNTVHDCSAGISLASENGGLLERIKIYNNIVYNNHTNGLEIGNWGEEGIPRRPIRDIKFINNTVVHNGTSDWGGGIHLENPDAKEILIRNNIFSQNRLAQISNEAKLSAETLTVDHNLIDGFRDYEDEIHGTTYVEEKPLFVNPSEYDFRLKEGSPAVDRGSPIHAPRDDFDGSARPQRKGYDLGAFEYRD
ncbi:MAG: DUF1565 domain-containing protein [Planctomycetes bacterium]|nr:DUF1565 domain-containing protein [Planctomycetota bacterium]